MSNNQSQKDKIIGPQIPDHLKTKLCNQDDHESNDEHNNLDDEDNDVMFPALPPDFVVENQIKVIGPQIPENLKTHVDKEHDDNDYDDNNDNNDEVINESDDDDDDIIGPILPTQDDLNQSANLNRTVKSTKESEVKVEREEWMTVVPKSVAKKLGMKSVTSFSKRSGESLKSKDESSESSLQRDKEMAELLEEYKKANKRDVSLLEIHQQNIKKKKINENNSNLRRPFNPEIDLQLNRFDSKQTKSVINKAQLLDSRFSQGTNKFL